MLGLVDHDISSYYNIKYKWSINNLKKYQHDQHDNTSQLATCDQMATTNHNTEHFNNIQTSVARQQTKLILTKQKNSIVIVILNLYNNWTSTKIQQDNSWQPALPL